MENDKREGDCQYSKKRFTILHLLILCPVPCALSWLQMSSVGVAYKRPVCLLIHNTLIKAHSRNMLVVFRLPFPSLKTFYLCKTHTGTAVCTYLILDTRMDLSALTLSSIYWCKMWRKIWNVSFAILTFSIFSLHIWWFQ